MLHGQRQLYNLHKNRKQLSRYECKIMKKKKIERLKTRSD